MFLEAVLSGVGAALLKRLAERVEVKQLPLLDAICGEPSLFHFERIPEVTVFGADRRDVEGHEPVDFTEDALAVKESDIEREGRVQHPEGQLLRGFVGKEHATILR